MNGERKASLDQSVVVNDFGNTHVRIVQDARGRWVIYANGCRLEDSPDLGDAMQSVENLLGAPCANWKRAPSI